MLSSGMHRRKDWAEALMGPHYAARGGAEGARTHKALLTPPQGTLCMVQVQLLVAHMAAEAVYWMLPRAARAASCAGFCSTASFP